MEAPKVKYYYVTGGLPSLVLKPEETGVIQAVSLYNDKDYLRGDNTNLDMSALYVRRALGESYTGRAATLEECADQHLIRLSTGNIGSNEALPLEELRELRELEKYLRATMGNYRSNT